MLKKSNLATMSSNAAETKTATLEKQMLRLVKYLCFAFVICAVAAVCPAYSQSKTSKQNKTNKQSTTGTKQNRQAGH